MFGQLFYRFIVIALFAAGLSEDSDYTSEVSFPNQQHPYAQSYHHANSSSSQFESTARQLKPLVVNTSDQCNQQHAANNANYQELQNETQRPKRELPFGGSTDLRNIKLANQYQIANGSQKLPMANLEEDPLFYNSRPRRALPQINFNKEKYVIL